MHSSIGKAALQRLNKPLENANRSLERSDAMRLVRLAAEPRPVGDQITPAIGRACRALDWKFNRTREIWYGNARRIEAHEMDALRALERQRDAKAAATEHARYLEQLHALRARLHVRDADFHRADVMALDWLLNEFNRRP